MSTLDKALQALLQMAHWDLLWTNATPTSTFPVQTLIVPNISQYDLYAVFYSLDTEETLLSSTIGQVGHGTYMLSITGTGYGRRAIATQSGDSVYFQGGRLNNANDNKYQIPWYIYGFNF